MKIHIRGPLKGTYSLALVNREFAKSLLRMSHDVTVSSDRENDLHEDPFFMESGLNSCLKNINSMNLDILDVISQNSWPIPKKIRGKHLSVLHCFAWEETLISPELALVLSQNDLITTTARSVSDTLLNSGVTSPSYVIHNGTDHIPQREWRARRESSQLFTFLHVSSCFDRKGIKNLVSAFIATFAATDPVRLLIKTFPNPHNVDLKAWIETQMRVTSHPPIVTLMFSDLSTDEYISLLDQADCLVSPSYGEGFLIPAAEAMKRRVPVITSSWGGQTDFCNDGTAWLIDGKFEPARSHLSTSGSMWFNPDHASICDCLKQVYRSHPSIVEQKCEAGLRLLNSRFNWSDVSERFVAAVKHVSNVRDKNVTFSIVSTWDQLCGVSTFTQEMVAAVPENTKVNTVYSEICEDTLQEAPDIVEVRRVWTRDLGCLDSLASILVEDSAETILIEHHPGILSWDFLARLVSKIVSRKMVYVQLHSVRAGYNTLAIIAEQLKDVSRFIVSSSTDYMMLVNIVGPARVSYILLGTGQSIESRAGSELRLSASPYRIASFGFAYHHKGYHLLVHALAFLVQAGFDVNLELFCACAPMNTKSRNYIKGLIRLSELFNIKERLRIHVEFREMHDIIELLSSADVLVFPYEDVDEGASSAVRVGLRSRAPIIVSGARLFDDIRDYLINVHEQEPISYAREIARVLSDKHHRQSSLQRQDDAVRLTSWNVIAKSILKRPGLF